MLWQRFGHPAEEEGGNHGGACRKERPRLRDYSEETRRHML